MAYLTRQQSLKQWAQLVLQSQISNLNQIQNIQFTTNLLLKLDPQYFHPILSPTKNKQLLTFSQLFTQISKYYIKQIGTNIDHLLDININIYSTHAIQQIWELILGIAIKGRNRQKNINIILKMRTQMQQQLMRIISKLINKLGQNVSYIDNNNVQTNNNVNYNNNNIGNDTDIIIQLSQQNQQLRQKVQELTQQVNILKQKNKTIKNQLQEKNKQRKEIINLMIKQTVNNKSIYLYSSGSYQSISEFVKDLIGQVGYLTKDVTKKQQKVHFLEDINQDLKIAYSTVLTQLEQAKKFSKQTHVDIKQVQKQIEQLRAQNQNYAQRQKDLFAKISGLEQQKFYLKDIVQRLQTKNNKNQEQDKQKSQKNININQSIIQSNSFLEPQPKQTTNVLTIQHTSSYQQQSTTKNSRQATMRYQIDQIAQPNEKNKLQRQISHLQKKLNTVQEQNVSLQKINTILEKVINQFTKQSNQIIKKYQSEIQPVFEKFKNAIEEEKSKRIHTQEQLNMQQLQNQGIITQLLEKIKQKISAYDGKQIQYKKIIKRLQIQREQLLKTIKKFQPQPNTQQKPIKQFSYKITPQATSLNIPKQQKPSPPPAQKSKSQDSSSSSSSSSQKKQQQKMPTIKVNPVKPYPTQQKQQKQQYKLQVKSPIKNNINIAASIIMQQQQQQTNVRRRQYSFMRNRTSTYQFGNQNQVGFKQKRTPFNKLSIFGSQFLQESVNDVQDAASQINIQTQPHIQIIDITQIEQQLLKIKQHYIGITNQSRQLCTQLINTTTNTQKQAQRQSSIPKIMNNYQNLTSDTNKTNFNLDQYSKNLEQKSLKISTMLIQNIKLKNQNTILRQHLQNLSRQRKIVQQRLIYLHKQSSKTQQQRTKQQLLKLTTSINQIRNIMIQSQNSYLQLQGYMNQVMGQNQKVKGELIGQIKQLKQQLKKRQHIIQRMELESCLLMGAVLQFRNSAVRGY